MSSDGLYILHGRPGSGSSAIEAALKLAGLTHETIYFQKRADGNLPDEIHALNPLGQVPVLKLPDGQVMTESGAILIYLAEVAPKAKLAPISGSSDRAAFLRLMVFMAANSYMTDLRYYYPHRYAGGEANADLVRADALNEQMRNWTALEGMANNEAALLTCGFSVADLYLAMLVSWSQIEDFASRWPKLHSIAKRTASMPGLAEIWQRNEVAF